MDWVPTSTKRVKAVRCPQPLPEPACQRSWHCRRHDDDIPPHNLREVIDATICLIKNTDAELDDIMEFIKGPDFPTKGIIMGRAGIRAAYATGRGRIYVRARTDMEEFGQGRTRIVVTELPYQVNKARLIESIAEHVKNKKIEGISALRDESDRDGMRIVIELKRVKVVLNRLYASTQMRRRLPSCCWLLWTTRPNHESYP